MHKLFCYALSLVLLLTASFLASVTFADTIEPEVVIKQKAGSSVEEYRLNGKLYAIKVTPKCWFKFFCQPYYLVDVKGTGQFVRTDLEQADLLIPKWVLFKW